MEIARINKQPNYLNVEKTKLNSAVSKISNNAKTFVDNNVKKAIEEASTQSYHKNKSEKYKINTLTHKIADIAINQYKNFSKKTPSKSNAPVKYKQYVHSLASVIKGKKLDVSL